MLRARWTWVVGTLAMLFVAPTARAQGARDAARQVAALEDAWIQAVIARDAQAFDRLLTSDFVYTEDGHVSSRAQLIRDVTAGSDTVTSGRNEDLSVRVHGTAAIATGWLVLAGRGPTGAFERWYRYTDTWLNEGGHWRVVAAQDYLRP